MGNPNPHLLFKALADPNRLRILHILTQGERCVCDIMAVLKMGQSKVSRHLAYLKQSGLVGSRKDGLWMHYSLNKPKDELHRQLLDCIGTCLDGTKLFQRDTDLLRKRSDQKGTLG